MEDLYYAFNPWWENKKFECGIQRTDYLGKIEKIFSRKQIDIIIGSRRVGKTTIIKQLIKWCLHKNIPAKDIIYLSLDNPRLSKTTITEHLKLFRKIFMHSRSKKLYLFLDEIQETPGWEIELKSMYDLENVKIICSGSTSSLIKRQEGRLAGRQIVTVIYPLNFKEYLSFKKELPSKSEDYKFEALFEEYLMRGGYPENALHPSDDYLNNLIDDILVRDIVRLHSIKRISVLKDLLMLIASSVGSRTSFNKLGNILGIAVDTVKEYIGYLEASFLIKPLEKWATSYNERVYSQKKNYLFDSGIKTVLTGKGDLGVKVENAVFLCLFKKQPRIGYFAESEKEIDFVFSNFHVLGAVEVKYQSEINLKDKKFDGLRLFLKRFPKNKKISVISKDNERMLKEAGQMIEVIPAWKYLLKE
ncbi:MAG: ATP-binding protein [Candidatus Omnitrophota bacterium]